MCQADYLPSKCSYVMEFNRGKYSIFQILNMSFSMRILILKVNKNTTFFPFYGALEMRFFIKMQLIKKQRNCLNSITLIVIKIVHSYGVNILIKIKFYCKNYCVFLKNMLKYLCNPTRDDSRQVKCVMQTNDSLALRFLQKLQNELNFSWVNSIKITSYEPVTITVVVSNLDRVKEIEKYILDTYKKEEKVDSRKGRVTAKNVDKVDAVLYRIGMKNPELKVKENAKFEGQVVNIQIETVLQNAWGALLSDMNEDISNGKTTASENLQPLKEILRFVDVQFDKNQIGQKSTTLLAIINRFSK